MREMGRFAQMTIEQDAEGYVSFMANFQDWSQEEITVYCARLRREFRNPKIHGYFHVKVAWGRKP